MCSPAWTTDGRGHLDGRQPRCLEQLQLFAAGCRSRFIGKGLIRSDGLVQIPVPDAEACDQDPVHTASVKTTAVRDSLARRV